MAGNIALGFPSAAARRAGVFDELAGDGVEILRGRVG